MKLKNPFSEDVRLLFLYVTGCFRCNRSDRGLELHHIVGRASNSAFNACPLCTVCHSHIGHTLPEHLELLNATAKFLLENDYKPTEQDWEFITLWLKNN